MKSITIIVSILLASCFKLIAQSDFITPTRTYRNATVTETNAAFITIRHDGGIGKVRISDLSIEDQKRFNYSAEKAAAFESGQKQYNQKRKEAELEAKKKATTEAAEKWKELNAVVVGDKIVKKSECESVSGKVVFVAKDGVVVEYFWVGNYLGNGRFAEGYKTLFVKMDPSGRFDGSRIKIDHAYETGTKTIGPKTYRELTPATPYKR